MSLTSSTNIKISGKKAIFKKEKINQTFNFLALSICEEI